MAARLSFRAAQSVAQVQPKTPQELPDSWTGTSAGFSCEIQSDHVGQAPTSLLGLTTFFCGNTLIVFVGWFVCLLACLFFVCLFVCLFVSLFVCLFACFLFVVADSFNMASHITVAASFSPQLRI